MKQFQKPRGLSFLKTQAFIKWWLPYLVAGLKNKYQAPVFYFKQGKIKLNNPCEVFKGRGVCFPLILHNIASSHNTQNNTHSNSHSNTHNNFKALNSVKKQRLGFLVMMRALSTSSQQEINWYMEQYLQLAYSHLYQK